MHPPVLLVFHQVGKRSADSQIGKVADLTRHHWRGEWHAKDGFHSYDGRIPIVATTLELLREQGPAGPAFWRFGRDHRQPLLDAISNPRRDAALARRRAQTREAERRHKEREARRARCAQRRKSFTDARWSAVGGDGGEQALHPELCHNCAWAAQKRAEKERKAAEEAAAQEAAALAAQAEAEQRPRGFFVRFRP